MNQIALQRSVSDMVAEYEEKDAALVGEIEAFNQATRRLEMSACVGGAYGGTVFGRGAPSIYEKDLRKILLVSAWKAIYSRLNIDRLASAKDKRKWESTFADPPPLTMDNAIATFGDYLMRARWHLLRGLAEVFSDLDPAYKSHSKVKIGVKALPKRVIISGFGGYGSYGRDKLRDIVNALAAYRGQTLMEHAEFDAIDAAHRRGEDAHLDGRPIKAYRGGKDVEWTPPDRGVWIRRFHNGNAHLFFSSVALLDINRALAEFYGEVLPDAEGEEPGKKAPSTAVAKDLQFYPTPAPVIAQVLYAAGIYGADECSGSYDRPIYRILEPSCGDGRILAAVWERGHHVLGYEVHGGRAAEARAKGLPVVTANFLEQPPAPVFDRVVMNPPFYGRHYLHHVRHALKFLRPGGVLVAVLPATAWYDHGELKGDWTDLPVASFAESGTNVPTGYIVMRAPR